MNIGYELSRIAETINPLDGKTLQQARKLVSDVMHKGVTKNIYSDEYWQGPHEVQTALSRAGINWDLKSAEYSSDRKTKTWKIKVTFKNEKGIPKELNGMITTFQAGTVENPWKKYDMTAQIF